MPSVRSAILLAVLLLVTALITGFVSLFRPPDSGGMGQDSYGTRGFGYKGLFDVLHELNVPVRRDFSPPDPRDTTQTLVFLQPDRSIAGTEPAYLHHLLPWVENGGRIVVALPRMDRVDLRTLSDDAEAMKLPTILESLGLADVHAETQLSSEEVARTTSRSPRDDESLTDEVLEAFGPKTSPPQLVDVRGEGTLANASVRSLSIPRDAVQTLNCDEAKPLGTLSYTSVDGSRVLAAEFERGAGRIIVVSDYAVFHNRHLSREDNSVLAVHLLSPDGNAVVFDEFYHGLGVRGNPLYLMTRPGYAALAMGLLLFTALSVWRQAVFLGPSLPDPSVQRRDLAEYLSAMGRFFSLGAETRPFLIRQLRDGTLRELCRKLSLATDTHDVNLIAGMISRRDPELGERFRHTIADIDADLESRHHWSESETIDAMRRLTACLSTNT